MNQDGHPSDTWDRVQEIFLTAADLPPSDRARFLDRVCEGDTGLRGEVESLLRADSTGGSMVEAAIHSEAASMLEEEPSFVGSRLGVYRVVDEIGRGGMGAVYVAERDDDQFHKLVAIKVVKRGMDPTKCSAASAMSAKFWRVWSTPTSRA